MYVYMYQAALHCEACGIAICERLDAEGKAPTNPSDEWSYDSSDYPKGPEKAKVIRPLTATPAVAFWRVRSRPKGKTT